MPNILVSNDDGYSSEGIRLLYDLLSTYDRTVIVAPDSQQSASSHALTLHHPLRVYKQSETMWSVSGTPTDCVNLALNGLLTEKPVFMFSGVNHGANLGDDITYSGTVAAAMEAALLGVPSVALSLDDFSAAKMHELRPALKKAVDFVLANPPAAGQLYNINFPAEPTQITEMKITYQGERVYGDAIVEKIDPRGLPYYWIGGDILRSNALPGSDLEAVAHNCVSITPIKMNMTDTEALTSMQNDLDAWNE